MKKHTKIYYEAFGYSEGDWIPCELTGGQAVDIHHIESRGMGGDPQGKKDRIENLMAVRRDMHELYGDKPKWMSMLYIAHRDAMRKNDVKFSDTFIEKKIKQYE